MSWWVVLAFAVPVAMLLIPVGIMLWEWYQGDDLASLFPREAT